MKTILDDLKTPCRKCDGPAGPHVHNLHMCHACNGTGFTWFGISGPLFCDQDGVLADFDQGVYDRTGKWPKEFESDDAMWAALNAIPNFFAELPVVPGAIEFWNWLRPVNPFILTACPNSDYQNVALQKKHWIKTNLTGNPMVLPVVGGRNKGLFMHNVGEVLIDDYGRNIDAWEALGGTGIKHEGSDFEATKQALVKILIEKHLAKH